MSISATSRRITGVLALLVLTALLPLTAASAQDERTVLDLDLVADDVSDPVETSILYSRQTFGSAEQALVATSFDGADALASGSLQSGVGEAAATDTEGTAVTGRPLLFVDPTAGPEQALFDELSRLGVTSIILLGGESAVPPAVADAFEEAGFADVQRMGGTTRVATASLVAEYVLANSDTTTAYLSRAFGTAEDTDTAYADSSALGGWAASTGNPILLTATESLSLETSLLLQQGDIERVEIVGGPEAVSDDVEQSLVDSVRIMGASRWTVATRVELPSALVWIVAGTKVSIPQAFVGVVTAEILASNQGLGYWLARRAGQFDTTGAFAVLLALLIVGFSLDRVVTMLSNRALVWKGDRTTM